MSESDLTPKVSEVVPLPGATAAQTLDYDVTPRTDGASSAVRVPGYRLLEVLGRGGMGVVYKAIQEKANRPVALKMILAGAHAEQAEHLRFRAEAEAAARLSHPQIVQVYEVGETREGFPFFSQELIAGGTLAERLKQGPLRSAEAAALVEALARAMQYAHERGIVHRDLKPGNILLEDNSQEDSRTDHAKDTMLKNPDGKTIGRGGGSSASRSAVSSASGLGHLRPKISDFGLAKQLDSDDGLTRTGAILGSPAYMAPEQAFGQSKHVGPAADIYALGAILYECLTGRPPFKGATVADTLDQVRTMEPITVRAFAKEIPADLETICLHCLHKEPQRRYASADALAEDLRRFRDGQTISVRPVGNLERSWRWCRRNPWLAGMAAAAITFLISALGIAVFAYFDAEARNVQIEKKRQEAESAQKVAKTRLDQSLKALGLFATDFRAFCEDALVPGQNKAKLYEALIQQLEGQEVEDAGEASEDAIRNKAWMYQTMAIVYLDTQKNDKAVAIVDKGLAVTKAWLKLKPDDAYALSFHAAFLSLKGDTQYQNADTALAAYGEALKLRQQLAGNPEVDQYTPGRSYMQLADTYDKLREYDKALSLREQVCKVQLEKGADKDKLFESFDFWAWTCWKAYLPDKDEDRKQALLEKADELSRRALEYRPGARRTLERWSGMLRELGDRAYNQAKRAEAEKQPDVAQKQGDAAQKYYEKLADVARQLAIAPDLMYSLSNYGRSFYTLGLMQKALGKQDQARASFEKSRHVREQLVRDFANSPNLMQLRIDLLFSCVALGEHVQAVREADTMRSALQFTPAPMAAGTLYRLACIYSLSVAAVEEARAPQPLTDEDRALQAAYADKALAALERSHRDGNRDFVGTRMDADFIAIRGDPRFQKILDLEQVVTK